MTYDTSVQLNCCSIDLSNSTQQLVYYGQMENKSSDSACGAANNTPSSNKNITKLYMCVTCQVRFKFVYVFEHKAVAVKIR